MRYPEPEKNTVLAVTNPIDTLQETKTTLNKPLNINYRWKIILICLQFRGSGTRCKKLFEVRGPLESFCIGNRDITPNSVCSESRDLSKF